MTSLSIIIPAYNEAGRIVPTLRAFHEWLTAGRYSFEIIVVDDGSGDDTVFVLEELKHNGMPELSVVRVPINKGKGHAVRTGMLAARGAFRLFSDADGSTPVQELDKMLPCLQDGSADIVIGSRYTAGALVTKAQPAIRVLWSRLCNRIVQRVLLPGIADPHCGFKAFTAAAAAAVFSSCRVEGWSFDLELLAIARSQDLRIKEVGVQWANDERSKARIRQVPRAIADVYRVRRRLRSLQQA
ncbi:MAG: glycosyltransferase family 2 protein [Chitinophagaceae bacterium]|nr:glycosyltransferase family 2 protein [Chitinophagaceae bacterium]